MLSAIAAMINDLANQDPEAPASSSGICIVVGNGATWSRLEAKVKIQKNKIQKILNFECCLIFKSGSG